VQASINPHFKGFAKVYQKPSTQPITKMEFEIKRQRINKEDVKELIYHAASLVKARINWFHAFLLQVGSLFQSSK
jgi:hypothetical protein